jgi:hypothetical protein
MPAIGIPDPLPLLSRRTERSLNSSSSRTWKSSARTAWSPAPGTGLCTAAAPGRSATWTGGGSTATGHHLVRRLLPKAPPASRPSPHLPVE